MKKKYLENVLAGAHKGQSLGVATNPRTSQVEEGSSSAGELSDEEDGFVAADRRLTAPSHSQQIRGQIKTRQPKEGIKFIETNVGSQTFVSSISNRT